MLKSLLLPLFRIHAERRFRRFEEATLSPEKSFDELWHRTYRLLREGEFWNGRLKENLADNPITDYDTYRAAFEKAAFGNISPLNGEPLVHWAVSSGSSGPPKKFPITRSYKIQVHDIHTQTVHTYLRRFPRFLKTPVFYLAAHGPFGTTPGGVEVSYISNYNFRHLPAYMRAFYGAPTEILKDEETVLKWRPLYVLAQDASAFLSVTPSIIVALFKQIQDRGPELYGYLSGKTPLPAELPPLKVSRARLDQLEKAGLLTGNVDFTQVWPGLEFAACWTDSVCKLQAAELREMLKGKIPVIETPFSASEAWVTIPLSSEYSGGAINPASIVVEFWPVGGLVTGEVPQKLLKPWELVEGQEYEIFVTNLMGLVRYRMYDILRCTRYFNNVAEVTFVRKSSQEISLGLVCVSETELLQTLESIPELKGKKTFVCPSRNGRGLTLFVESSEGLPESIAVKAHRKLSELNPLYGEEAEVGSFQKLEVHPLEPGHSAWRLAHSQAKPYLIRHIRPDLSDDFPTKR